MTNVSAVEKMAELMQQMEENSPRVAALQYCLAQLEAKCAALAAENAGLNKFIKADCWVWDDKSEEYIDAVDCIPETPATDAFLAEVRASAFNDLCAEFVKHKALAGLGDRQKVTVFEATEALLHCAEQLDTQFRKGVQS